MEKDRRKLLKGTAALVAASAAVGVAKVAAKDKDKDKDKDKPKKKVYYQGGKAPEKTPLLELILPSAKLSRTRSCMLTRKTKRKKSP